MIKAEQKVLKRFNKGCVDYYLLEDGDRILIALSGGKDSLELVRLLAQRARIFKPHIEVEAAHIIMDNIPYETDRSYLQDFCDENGIRLHILHSSFDESTDPRKTRCFLCAWNRRKTLFEFAVNNGFNKIALGHHMDDILVTLLMNITFEGDIHQQGDEDIIHVTLLMNITFEGSHSTMQPSLPLKHYPLTIIRPLCLVHEADIRQVAEELHFTKQKALCPYEETTRRSDMQAIFQQLEQLNPEARYSLWRSVFVE